MAGKHKRRQHEKRPRAVPVVEVQHLPTHDRVEAFVQELRAGAAPLTRIIPVLAEVPRDAGPQMAATVPFLVIPVVAWSKVTTGDSIGHLVDLLTNKGGLWMAQNTTTHIEWTAGPTSEPIDQPHRASAIQPDATTSPASIRAEVAVHGAWNGRFALAAPADPLKAHLWCLAISPIVAFVPEEAANQAVPVTKHETSMELTSFRRILDNCFHTKTVPSSAIRKLVVSSQWPGFDKVS